MKNLYLIIVVIIFLNSCTTNVRNDNRKNQSLPLVGTWELISGMTIEDQDTTIIDYTKGQNMIKIINKSHFAFLRHDLNNGKDSSAIFVSGGGTYSLEGCKYTEHLEFCNYREWENNSFELEIRIEGDTLTTKGIEKIEALNVNHVNIEKFIRFKE